MTPSSILVLFIVSILAAAWALATVVRLGSTRRSAIFVAFIDLCFVGAFIAGVYFLRRIDDTNHCRNFERSRLYGALTIFGYAGREAGLSYANDLKKNCSMLYASWVFGIINTITFFITFILALFMHRQHTEVYTKEVRRSRHSSRRGQSRSGSRRSSSRRRYYV